MIRLSFTQGFLLGQLTIALIIFAFIKFFIFGEPPPSPSTSRPLLSTHATLSKKRSNAALRASQSNGLSTETILAKTYYNVKGHQPESLDWFNVLIAQTIAQLRADALHEGAILKSLHSILNGSTKPEWVQEIKITEVALGEEFPIFSNCRIIPVEGDGGSLGAPGATEGRLQARMDLDLSDVLTLGVETRLVLNWPRKVVAVLPIALAVSIVRFSGTVSTFRSFRAFFLLPFSNYGAQLSVTFIPSSNPATPATADPSQPSQRSSSSSSPTPGSEPTGRTSPTTLAFTFLPDYTLELSIRSLLGSRSRLQDVPKIAQLIEARVHQWFNERCVEPRFQQIVLPSLWPRKKNTRGGEEDQSDATSELPGEDRDPESVTDSQGDAGNKHDEADDQIDDRNRLEQRMRKEGAKLREAEEKSNKRTKPSREVPEGSNLRRRAGVGESGENESFRMPGGMPGELTT